MDDAFVDSLTTFNGGHEKRKDVLRIRPGSTDSALEMTRYAGFRIVDRSQAVTFGGEFVVHFPGVGEQVLSKGNRLPIGRG